MLKNSCIFFTVKITVVCLTFLLLILSLSLWCHLLLAKQNSSSVFLAQTVDLYVLDAGHGGRDGGAVSDQGLTEKEMNLSVTKKLRDYLILCGAETVMTRETDSLVCDEEDPALKGKLKITDLKNRLEIAEAYPSARFISIHMNKFSVEKYSGMQIYYSKNNAESKVLASQTQERISTILQPTNTRKVKAAGSNIFLLDRLQIPAVLIECGFLSNIAEAERLSQKDYQIQMSVLIADSLLAN